MKINTIKNNKLESGLNELRDIKMTADEKGRIFENVLNSYPLASPIKSPYVFRSFLTSFSKNRLVYYGSISCLVVILSSGVVFASGGSLPGDTLYPVKVRFVEPVRGAFVFSNKSKIEYESSLTTERLIEAETLANNDKLDEANQKQLNSLLERHSKDFNKAVEGFRKENSVRESENDEAIANFQTSLNAHEQVLKFIKEHKNKKAEIRTQENTSSESIDSEGSVKEASIFLRAGLKLKERN